MDAIGADCLRLIARTVGAFDAMERCAFVWSLSNVENISLSCKAFRSACLEVFPICVRRLMQQEIMSVRCNYSPDRFGRMVSMYFDMPHLASYISQKTVAVWANVLSVHPVQTKKALGDVLMQKTRGSQHERVLKMIGDIVFCSMKTCFSFPAHNRPEQLELLRWSYNEELLDSTHVDSLRTFTASHPALHMAVLGATGDKRDLPLPLVGGTRRLLPMSFGTPSVGSSSYAAVF